MTVEADHDYYVGTLDALVHNACSSTSGENPAANAGRAMHDEFTELADAQGYTVKTALNNGKIPDAFKISEDGMSAIVRELKPGNAAAVARGLRQLAGYAQQISTQFGIPLENITQILETY